MLVEVLAVGVDGTDDELVSGAYGEAPGEEQLVIGHESPGPGREPAGNLRAGLLRPAPPGTARTAAPAAAGPSATTARTTGGRNTIERAFNQLKTWRGLATRYGKLALTYRGGLVVRTIVHWLRRP